ncbi:dTDP-4-dehydrorhamnose 3,5-epimerase [Roseibium polysiphoniae]|uniref:dTDP-4-dehydrorhamnose 3,5-epimerase n=1 Tax=Roseibium polysiphoniae TaxID=2571221 RepID=A0ABR9C9Q5_9HYPH|nr:dTDP-4-dehydrorhamnose 3,5-epimerase [Roseibium polysiphoniae]MBD8876644.1 dTDP-4-dehydrorhamnose 3,5-epimerase [Roseibium polysiphoniae]
MVAVKELSIPAVKIIVLSKHNDERGFFSEAYNKRCFSNAGIDIDFVQDNHAFSAKKGTVRGLHFQIPPFAQDKLIRVVSGSILDVVVDLRTGSSTYGQHVSTLLCARGGNQILVPVGFAHGMVTLEPDTEILYKVSNYYSPSHDRGVLWNDPELAIDWGVSGADAHLSKKDKNQPRLSELPAYFTRSGEE